MTSAIDRVAILRERMLEAARALSVLRAERVICPCVVYVERVRRQLDDALEYDARSVDVDEVNRANE